LNTHSLNIYFQSVTLQTDVGPIKIELFCEDCPKICENFLALCASDYYNDSPFHRNIKGFIVQTGDPTGTGKGGTSIWERKFEDDFKDSLRVKIKFGFSLLYFKKKYSLLSAAHRKRNSFDGKQWSQHEWITVLHNLCSAASLRFEIFDIWKVFDVLNSTILIFN
jgi:cyclophilin family peptidyl-prolyl cis-trans isomerase